MCGFYEFDAITNESDNYTNDVLIEIVDGLSWLKRFNRSSSSLIFTTQYLPEVQALKHRINKKSFIVNNKNAFMKKRCI